MSNFTAVYDACVLYSAPLRDLLMHLALSDLFRAKWTAAIHDEWTQNLLKDRPDLTQEQLDRTRQLMDSHVRDCLVTHYESLIPALTLPDPSDRHVRRTAGERCAGEDELVFQFVGVPMRPSFERDRFTAFIGFGPAARQRK